MSVEDLHRTGARTVPDLELEYKFAPVRLHLIHKAIHPRAAASVDPYTLIPHQIQAAQALGTYKRKQLVLANYDRTRRYLPIRRIW